MICWGLRSFGLVKTNFWNNFWLTKTCPIILLPSCIIFLYNNANKLFGIFEENILLKPHHYILIILYAILKITKMQPQLYYIRLSQQSREKSNISKFNSKSWIFLRVIDILKSTKNIRQHFIINQLVFNIIYIRKIWKIVLSGIFIWLWNL